MSRLPKYLSALLLTLPCAATADQVITDDLVVIGSECVGLDCSNGMTFARNGMVLRENNTRIVFESDGASTFRLAANESTNGGDSEFRIDSPENSLAATSSTTSSGSLGWVPGTVMPDGRLQVSRDYYNNIGLEMAPDTSGLDLTDTTTQVNEEYAYVAAGGFSASGPFYTINNGATVTAADGSALTGTMDGYVASMTLAADGNAITLGRGSSSVDGAVSVGSSGDTRQIKNLADAINAQDLITLRQIRSTADQLEEQLASHEDELNQVSAMTVALSALQPNPRASGPFSLSVGVGAYDDQQAVAVGGLWSVNKNTFLRLAASKAGDSDSQASLSLAMGW